MNIVQFPQEALVNIFSFLDPKSLIESSKVCKCFHQIAMDKFIWKTHFPIEPKGVKTDTNLQQLIANHIERFSSYNAFQFKVYFAGGGSIEIKYCKNYFNPMHSYQKVSDLFIVPSQSHFNPTSALVPLKVSDHGARILRYSIVIMTPDKLSTIPPSIIKAMTDFKIRNDRDVASVPIVFSVVALIIGLSYMFK